MQKEILYSYQGKKMKGKVLSPPLDTLPHYSETNFALKRTYIIQLVYVSVTVFSNFSPLSHSWFKYSTMGIFN